MITHRKTNNLLFTTREIWHVQDTPHDYDGVLPIWWCYAAQTPTQMHMAQIDDQCMSPSHAIKHVINVDNGCDEWGKSWGDGQLVGVWATGEEHQKYVLHSE